VETKVAADPERAWPRIDWPFLLDDTEGKFATLAHPSGRLVLQTLDGSDRPAEALLEVNRNLTEMLSEI
jgi:hypothetical protein